MTPAGIESATFRFVAQHILQYILGKYNVIKQSGLNYLWIEKKKAWFHDKVSDISSPNCFFSSRVGRCTMESLICMLLHVRLGQWNVTCEQSWRRFGSSYERKIVASVAVLLQGKRNKQAHMESYCFLSTISTKSRQNVTFEDCALLYVWEMESSNLGSQICQTAWQFQFFKTARLDTASYWNTNFFHLFTPFFLYIISNINLPFVTSYVFQNKKIIYIIKAVRNSIYFENTWKY